MDRILLLLRQQGNRRLLAEWLARNYQVVLGDHPNSLQGPFDLAILDGPALHQLRPQMQARKRSEEPVFLPFLLITSRQDTSLLTQDLWQTVDELLLTPIDRFELQARLEVLLRTRQDSLELKHRNAQLETLVAELTSAFEGATTEGQLADILLKRALEATQGRGGAVVLLDEGRPRVVSQVADALPQEAGAEAVARAAWEAVLHLGPPGIARLEPRVHNDPSGTVLTAPLYVKGQPVGVLVLLKLPGAPFETGDVKLMQSLCAQAGVFLHNLQQAQRLVEAAHLRHQVEAAKAVQQQLLPNTDLRIAGLEIASAYMASNQVGGDYYDVFEVAPGQVVALIADVSGHSMPSGLLMTAARSTVRLLAYQEPRPSDVLRRLNKALYRDMDKTGLFLSIFVLVLDLDTKVLKYASAGHNPTLHYQYSSGKLTSLDPTGLLIGILPDADYEELELSMAAGDTLVLYTDGLTEARSSTAEFFGEERLGRLVVQTAQSSAQQLADTIVTGVRTHTQDNLTDDVTLLVVRLDAYGCRGDGG